MRSRRQRNAPEPSRDVAPEGKGGNQGAIGSGQPESGELDMRTEPRQLRLYSDIRHGETRRGEDLLVQPDRAN